MVGGGIMELLLEGDGCRVLANGGGNAGGGESLVGLANGGV